MKGKKTGGRKAGTPNKVTTSARAAIELAAEQLGGGERLAEWAGEDPVNERAFWVNIYCRLLPFKTEMSGEDGKPIIQRIERVIIEPNQAPDREGSSDCPSPDAVNFITNGHRH